MSVLIVRFSDKQNFIPLIKKRADIAFLAVPALIDSLLKSHFKWFQNVIVFS